MDKNRLRETTPHHLGFFPCKSNVVVEQYGRGIGYCKVSGVYRDPAGVYWYDIERNPAKDGKFQREPKVLRLR